MYMYIYVCVCVCVCIYYFNENKNLRYGIALTELSLKNIHRPRLWFLLWLHIRMAWRVL